MTNWTPVALAELHAAAFELPRPWSAAEFTDLLATRGVELLTTQDGFLLARLTPPEAEILTLAVWPQARRGGIGRDLVARFLERARSEGCEEAFLEVAEPNTAAQALYARAGFTQTGLRKDYYSGPTGDRVSALVLCKSLSADRDDPPRN